MSPQPRRPVSAERDGRQLSFTASSTASATANSSSPSSSPAESAESTGGHPGGCHYVCFFFLCAATLVKVYHGASRSGVKLPSPIIRCTRHTPDFFCLFPFPFSLFAYHWGRLIIITLCHYVHFSFFIFFFWLAIHVISAHFIRRPRLQTRTVDMDDPSDREWRNLAARKERDGGKRGILIAKGAKTANNQLPRHLAGDAIRSGFAVSIRQPVY